LAHKNIGGAICPADLSLSKIPFGAFRQFLQSAARIICTPLAYKFHTCSLRSVFVHVQAAAKNDLDTVLRIRGELCEAFLTVLHIGGAICPADFHTYVYAHSIDFFDDLRFSDRDVDSTTAYPFSKGYLRQYAAVFERVWCLS